MLVQFENVHLRYSLNRPILKAIHFEIEPGSFHFLTGPSGAGKSSLLKLIYRDEHPSRGTVKLFGEDLSLVSRDDLPALRRRIGVVFQDFRLIPHLSALENVALPLRLAGAEETQIRAHVTELLQWVGLGDRLDALPAELSGGEQQRVAIARAVVNKPSLLLADEPTGNIDDNAALKILHLLTELNKMGTAILFATHQTHIVKRMAKPSLTLKSGRLITTLAEAA